MKTKLFFILFFLLISFAKSNDAFISGYGKSYGEARSEASKVALLQSMRIIGQNYYTTKDGSWVVILKVKRYYED